MYVFDLHEFSCFLYIVQRGVQSVVTAESECLLKTEVAALTRLFAISKVNACFCTEHYL